MLTITILTAARAWGGMEVHTARLADVLTRMGHCVTLIDGGALYQSHLPSTSKVHLVNHLIPLPFPALGLHAALKILKRFRADVCIFPKGCFEQGNWCIDLAAKLVFRKYVIIEHLSSGSLPPKTTSRHFAGMLPGLGLWWYRRRVIRYVNRFFRFRLPDRVVCVSKMIERELKGIYGFSAEKVVTIHNGIDTELFAPSEEFRQISRDSWGIPSNALVFGCMGRLEPIKGFDLALEGFQRVKALQKHHDAWLVIVGDGQESDALKRKASDLNIADRVKFVGYSLRPWEVYPAFDIFLLPSRNEGMPLALLEAMSCGCWPIATAVGGIPEVINDDSIGCVVSMENPEDFFSAMIKCIEAPADFLKRATTTRGQILASFEGKKQYQSMAKVIADLATS